MYKIKIPVQRLGFRHGTVTICTDAAMTKGVFFMKTGYKTGIRTAMKLLLCGLSVIFLETGSTSVQAKEKSSFHIPVEDIIRRTCEKTADNTVSFLYRNKKGTALTINGTENRPGSGTPADASLPSSYDLRKKGLITPIKDQGYSGSCWAFASLKSLESNLIKTKQAAPSVDLSENHLSWFLFHPSADSSDPLYLDGISFREDAAKSAYQKENSTIRNSYSFSSYYHALPYLKGSNALLGTFVLAKWSGAVTEAAAPFDATSTKNLFAMADKMKNNATALRYQRDYCLTDSNCYDSAPQEEIKAAIMNTGALEASFFSDNSNLKENSDGTFCYYQTEKDTTQANHCITIIGWDDNYSREQFGDTAPSRDGAWLIANSYGNAYGQKGYFWLSYEEPSLGEIYSFQGTKSTTYDNNYQYDGSGWGSALIPPKDHPMKVANIFTANKDYTQSLKAVAFYTVTPKQPYTIQVYRNVQKDNPTGGILAATLSGTENYSGYHTITLPKAVSLKANERFSVVVSYPRTNEENGLIPVEGTSLYSPMLSMNFHSTPGKSFCYAYAASTESGESSYQWTDLSLTPISTGEDSEKDIFNNVCIKAFTTNEKKAGTIRFSAAKYKLGAGETLNLSAVVKSASQKTVEYSSSLPSVATVSASGKIKAKKKGSTVITASLPTGAYATVQIKVKAAPKKISTIPKKKKSDLL